MQVTMDATTGATQGCATGGGTSAKKADISRQQAVRKDTVSISRKSARVKNLQSQKKRVSKSKNRLVKSTQQKGEDLSTIRTKLMQYEAKLKMLNDQIARAVREEAKAHIEKSLKERRNSGTAKLRPDEEYARLAKEAGLTTSLALGRDIQNGKARARGEAAKLEEDIREKRRHGTPQDREEASKKEVQLRRLQEKMQG